LSRKLRGDLCHGVAFFTAELDAAHHRAVLPFAAFAIFRACASDEARRRSPLGFLRPPPSVGVPKSAELPVLQAIINL